MPVTKSEMMFFAAGAAFGAAAGANWPLLKEKFGPLRFGRTGRGKFGRQRFVRRCRQTLRRKGRGRAGCNG